MLVHPLLNEPCLCGLLRAAILLPEQWLSCGDGRLVEAILAHELAHARRHDHLVNLAQRLVEVVLFFSPAVHWLSQSLRRQREYCADALAVRMTRDPLALAGALEWVARLRLLSQARPALTRVAGRSVRFASSSNSGVDWHEAISSPPPSGPSSRCRPHLSWLSSCRHVGFLRINHRPALLTSRRTQRRTASPMGRHPSKRRDLRQNHSVH